MTLRALADPGMGGPGGHHGSKHGLAAARTQSSQNTDAHMHNRNPTKR